MNFKDKYFDEIKNSKNIHLFLTANFKDLDGDERKIDFINLESFNRDTLKIFGKNIVFCMGGIENSRFLLWIEKKHDNKFFDKDLPIGKYWMEHPHFTLGKIIAHKANFHIEIYL